MNTDIDPPAAAVKSDTQAQFWRDVLPIHPAAELFPRLSPDELKALGADIKQNGLQQPIAIIETPRRRLDGTLQVGDPPLQEVLDGISRLDAMEAAGVRVIGKDGQLHPQIQRTVVDTDEVNPVAFVISANIHRRHLDAETRRKLIAKLLKASPEKSDRQIAEQTKTDHKTVGAVRTKMESTGEIPQLEKTTGKDGKARKQPTHKKPTKTKAAADRAERRQEQAREEIADRIEDGAGGNPEQSAEERKRLYESQDRQSAGGQHADHQQVVPGNDAAAGTGIDLQPSAAMNDAVTTFFDSATASEIYGWIPFGRRAEVGQEFLRIKAASDPACLLAVLFEHGTIWESSADIIAAKIFETVSRTKAAAIGAKLRALTAPKGKSPTTTQFPKLTLEPTGTTDASGNPNFAQPARNRSRAKA